MGMGEEIQGGASRGEAADGLGETLEERVQEPGGVFGKAVDELKVLGLWNILPLRDILADRPWNLVWVRWFAFATFFPLFMVFYTANSETGFQQIAFAFGLYFALIWGLIFHLIIRPGRIAKREILQVGAFTAFVGIFLVLVIQQLPVIRSLYRATESHFMVGKMIGFVLGVGVLEEAAKALPLWWLFVKKRRTATIAKITFLGCVSGFGFGVSEAGSYSLQYAIGLKYGQMGFGDYMVANFVRLITLPFLHAVWAGTLAYFLALGVHNRKLLNGLIAAGLVVAAVQHGLYDTFSNSFLGFLLAVAALLLFLSYIRQSERLQQRIRDLIDARAPEEAPAKTAAQAGNAASSEPKVILLNPPALPSQAERSESLAGEEA